MFGIFPFHWCCMLQVAVATNPTHYGNPKTGCESDEEAVRVQGLSGDFCSPKCNSQGSCPSDVPKGDSATPQCALRTTTGDKYCALICQSDSDCGIWAAWRCVGFPVIANMKNPQFGCWRLAWCYGWYYDFSDCKSYRAIIEISSSVPGWKGTWMKIMKTRINQQSKTWIAVFWEFVSMCFTEMLSMCCLICAKLSLVLPASSDRQHQVLDLARRSWELVSAPMTPPTRLMWKPWCPRPVFWRVVVDNTGWNVELYNVY